MKCRQIDMSLPLCFYALNFAHRREKRIILSRVTEPAQGMYPITISKLFSASLILKHFLLD